LTTCEVEDVLIQAKEIGIQSIGIAGGEPLLRHDLIRIIKKAHDLQFKNIHITTNGLLLTEEKAISLIESGLNRISISIDGVGNLHDSLRGVDRGYERSIGAVKNLAVLRDKKYPYLDVGIGTTLMKPTLSAVFDVVEIAKSLNVACGFNLIDISTYFFKNIDKKGLWIEEDDRDELELLVSRLHNIKLENPELIGTSHSSIEYMRTYFANPKREDIPCYLGYSKIYLGPHGDIYSGCWALPPMGNVREKKLKEIVYSEDYKCRLKNMFQKRCPGCSCNYPTNLWYHIPSLINELRWYIKGSIIWKH